MLRRIGVVCVVAALTTVPAARATAPGVNGVIAFERRPQSENQVWRITPDGALEQRLGSEQGGLPA